MFGMRLSKMEKMIRKNRQMIKKKILIYLIVEEVMIQLTKPRYM